MHTLELTELAAYVFAPTVLMDDALHYLYKGAHECITLKL